MLFFVVLFVVCRLPCPLFVVFILCRTILVVYKYTDSKYVCLPLSSSKRAELGNFCLSICPSVCHLSCCFQLAAPATVGKGVHFPLFPFPPFSLILLDSRKTASKRTQTVYVCACTKKMERAFLLCCMRYLCLRVCLDLQVAMYCVSLSIECVVRFLFCVLFFSPLFSSVCLFCVCESNCLYIRLLVFQFFVFVNIPSPPPSQYAGVFVAEERGYVHKHC